MILRTLLVIGLLSGQTSAADVDSADVRRVEAELLPVASTHEQLGTYTSIQARMRAYGVPGLSVAVIEDGRIAWAKAYGVADSSAGAAVTPDTLFQAASISKPLAALGALLLVQRGKLGLDEDVNRYLQAWKVPSNAFTAAHPITLRTLLDHSSALSDVAFDNYSPTQRWPGIAAVLNDPSTAIHVESVPGRQYNYTATAYVVLQQLMVDASGQPFDVFMQSNVLRPLGMARSTFATPLPESLRSSAAMGHYSGTHRLADGYRTGPELAVAGLWTTPSDLARYIISVQQWQASAGGLISPALARQMVTPQIAFAGLGMVLSGDGEHVRFGHDGFNEGYESAMVGYIQGGRGAVVMANSGFAYMLIKEVLGSIARVYGWPQYDSTNQWPPSASIRQQEVTSVPREVRAAAVGRYSLDAATTLRIFVQDDRLYVNWPRQGDAEIFATADGRLFCPQLTFSELGDPFLRLNARKNGGAELLAAGGQVVMRRKD
jgi:CubicO group peptidase (beta-lactamase class C family)